MSSASASAPPIHIIGAGIVGLSAAWHLAAQNREVTLWGVGETHKSAAWASAGLIAPAYEAEHGQMDGDLRRSLFESRNLWDDFLTRLNRISGYRLQLSNLPSLAIKDTPTKSINQATSLEKALKKGLSYEWLERDTHIDNRSLLLNLLEACQKSGVIIKNSPWPVTAPFPVDAQILIAAGHKSGQLLERPEWLLSVKGEMLGFKVFEGAPRHVIREDGFYIVPKKDQILVGASSVALRSAINNLQVSKVRIKKMKIWAQDVCPAFKDQKEATYWAGIRPATPDGLPIIGQVENNLYVATGSYRNGILLAPLMAKWVSDMMATEETSDIPKAFSPDRFN